MTPRQCDPYDPPERAPTDDDRPSVAELAARVAKVRELYGLGQRLPGAVSVFQPVPEGLPIERRGHVRKPPGAMAQDDRDPCRRCGAVEWVRRFGYGYRKCRACERTRERNRKKRHRYLSTPGRPTRRTA